MKCTIEKQRTSQKLFQSILCGCATPEKYNQLTDILSDNASEVVFADYGRASFELAMERFDEGTPFDLVILDVDLPRIGGYSVAALLRENGYKGTIVSMSLEDMAFYEFDSERCGCDSHLSGKNLSRTLPRVAQRRKRFSENNERQSRSLFQTAAAG